MFFARLALLLITISISARGAEVKPNLADFIDSYVSREQWGACEPTGDMTWDQIKCKFAVHHSAGSDVSSAETVRNIQRYHQHGRQWSDAGYHFFIGIDGKCFEGRKIDYQGAHVLNHNPKNIGLCFLGCFESSEANAVLVSEEMITKMGEVIGVLGAFYNIDISRITVKGHKEHEGATTICPGDRVLERMDDIVAVAEAKKIEVVRRLDRSGS